MRRAFDMSGWRSSKCSNRHQVAGQEDGDDLSAAIFLPANARGPTAFQQLDLVAFLAAI